MLMATSAPIAEIRKPPQPLERELDLSDTPAKRDTQGGLRPLAQDSVGFEAVSDLKPSHTLHERPLVSFGAREWRFRRQIA